MKLVCWFLGHKIKIFYKFGDELHECSRCGFRKLFIRSLDYDVQTGIWTAPVDGLYSFGGAKAVELKKCDGP